MIESPRQRALIFGINGQDGSLLANYLISHEGLEVFGTVRSEKTINVWRVRKLGLQGRVHIRVLELSDFDSVRLIIEDIMPDYLYLLAGYTFTVDAMTSTVTALSSNLLFPVAVMEAVRDVCPHSKLLIANSIYAIGSSSCYSCVDENISFSCIPNMYSYTKRSLLDVTEILNCVYPLNIYNVILANHESFLRGSKFVTMKIISTLIAIRDDPMHKPLSLGDIYAVRDWSSATEFVEGFHKLILNKSPGNYIFGRGVQESVKQFLEIALDLLDFSYEIKEVNGYTAYYCNDRLIVETNTPHNCRTLDPKLPKLSGKYPACLLDSPMTDLTGIISDIIEKLA